MWTRFSATLLLSLRTAPPTLAVPDVLAETRAAEQSIALLRARRAG